MNNFFKTLLCLFGFCAMTWGGYSCSTKKTSAQKNSMNNEDQPFNAVVDLPPLGGDTLASHGHMPRPIGGGIAPVSALPPIVIYKTRGDYRELVPIRLSGDGETIVSYPSRYDLGSPDHFMKPRELSGGYLLDHRGVGLHTAFLRLTYSEYYALDQDPSLEELKALILDANPFTFLAVCDRGYFETFGAEEFERYIAEGMPRARILINCK